MEKHFQRFCHCPVLVLSMCQQAEFLCLLQVLPYNTCSALHTRVSCYIFPFYEITSFLLRNFCSSTGLSKKPRLEVHSPSQTAPPVTQGCIFQVRCSSNQPLLPCFCYWYWFRMWFCSYQFPHPITYGPTSPLLLIVCTIFTKRFCWRKETFQRPLWSHLCGLSVCYYLRAAPNEKEIWFSDNQAFCPGASCQCFCTLRKGFLLVCSTFIIHLLDIFTVDSALYLSYWTWRSVSKFRLPLELFSSLKNSFPLLKHWQELPLTTLSDSMLRIF